MEAYFGGLRKSGVSRDSDAVSSQIRTRSKRSLFQQWVEKYRPDRMDEVAHQNEIVAVLKTSVRKLDLPNLLFYGPPGTGKTSTILAAARELFGDMYRDRILELNASDERGISVIREKVKNFAQLSASSIRTDGLPCPPFKIVILDEADSMTAAAQAALRRTLEVESKTTRFCLICNYVTRIIEPITSRCAKFRFKPLDSEILLLRLKHICSKESVSCSDEALEMLIETSDGDMRRAITMLQSAASFYSGDRSISRNDIIELSEMVDDAIIRQLIEVCFSGSQEKIDKCVKSLMAQGYSACQVLLQLHEVIVQSDEFSDKQKSSVCERIAISDKRLMDGADEYLQIMDVCSTIMQQICQSAILLGADS